MLNHADTPRGSIDQDKVGVATWNTVIYECNAHGETNAQLAFSEWGNAALELVVQHKVQSEAMPSLRSSQPGCAASSRKNEAPKKKVRPLPILRGRGHSTKGLQRCHVAKALCASCLILTNTRCKAGSEWAAALGWTTTLCLPSDLATAWLQLGNTLSPHQALFKLCAALANPTHAYDFQALAVRLQSHSINLLTHSIVRDGT